MNRAGVVSWKGAASTSVPMRVFFVTTDVGGAGVVVAVVISDFHAVRNLSISLRAFVDSIVCVNVGVEREVMDVVRG